MIELNNGSVTDALLSCYSHFNRRVGIVFSTYQRMYDFAISLQRQQREGLVPATHYKRSAYEIFFDTGSSIKMVNASNLENLYGCSFHTILYDPWITGDEVLAHLESCEEQYHAFGGCVRPVAEMKIDPKPLDDFLNGFSVIKP